MENPDHAAVSSGTITPVRGRATPVVFSARPLQLAPAMQALRKSLVRRIEIDFARRTTCSCS